MGGLALDPSGEVLLVGNTNSNDFPTINAFQGSLLGATDAFVTKLSADGSALVFSTYLGGHTPVNGASNSTTNGNGNAIATDAAGDGFVTGGTYASDFPLKNPYSSTPFGGGVSTAYITEFSATGALSYSTYFPARSGSAIALDSTGSLYVVGDTPYPAFPQVNPLVTCTVNQNCPDNWLTKFNAAGSTVIFSTTFFATSLVSCGVRSMALDSANDVYIIGPCLQFSTLNLQNPISNVGGFYLAEFAAAGSSLLFTTMIPAFARNCVGCNTAATGPISVALDSGGSIFVAGLTEDLPLVAPEQPAFGGAQSSSQLPFTDGFLMKIVNINAPAAGVPGTVSFGAQPVGTSSSATQVQLANLGSSNLVVTSLQASGDFAETDTCVDTISGASACNINITFTPTLPGTRTGAITITDNASGSPQSFALTGIGAVAQVNLMPQSLTFPTQSPGTTSANQTVQVSNTGQANLLISRIDVSADFQESNTCTASVPPGSNCTVSVAFSPSASANGTVTGTLTITDNAPSSPQTVPLTGTAGMPSLGLAMSGSIIADRGGRRHRNLHCLDRRKWRWGNGQLVVQWRSNRCHVFSSFLCVGVRIFGINLCSPDNDDSEDGYFVPVDQDKSGISGLGHLLFFLGSCTATASTP